MDKANHDINDLVIDYIGEDRIEELYKKHGNYRFSFSSLMMTWRRRIAKRLMNTHTMEQIAATIKRSIDQTKRIIESL